MSEGTPPPRSTQRLAWAPRPAVVVVGWLLTAAFLAGTLLSTMPEGRILAGIATLGVGLFAVFGTVARPRLAADPDGIAVRRLGAVHTWPWSAVTVRVAKTRRLGREATLLEIDAVDPDETERLIVLGWLDLGADPEEVAEALRALQI